MNFQVVTTKSCNSKSIALNDPELILADEPTGNLDPETSDEIMKLLIKINKESETTILHGHHNYNLLENLTQEH